jgi:hypothetical protein
MSDINFQPIFDYIDNSQNELKQDLVSLMDGRFDEVKTQIANLTHQVQRFNDESQVSKYRLDRLEGWAGKVGNKTNIPIEF